MVGNRVIDVSREWRTFSMDGRDDTSRVGGPENLLLDGSDLTTIIGKKDSSKGSEGNEYGGSKYQNRRSMSSSDRALVRAC